MEKEIVPSQNGLLNIPVEMRKVAEVVDQMADGKDLGPDGFAMNFFHHLWGLIKEEAW